MKNTIPCALLFMVLYTSCNNEKENIEKPYTVQEVSIQEVISANSTEEPPPPPPPRHTSKFATFSEWLKNLCDIENPDSRVQYYEVFLLKKDNPPATDQAQYFMGIRGSEKNRKEDAVYNEKDGHFYPREVYLTPSTSVYSQLNEEQAIQKVKEELKAFIQSSQFKQCFLRKAKSIRLREEVVL
ncbi:hypothetical protein U0035_02550 [Niabella yanshanensis]|uniref:Lipoprotein n=1 Tax=Niabella yanshanensis TaxID=577386 RepID=A0ABZ0WAC6_9BACT|nr:hypothetical protein [Niabella yanshanensis]WQD39026.1 hypothetical protein U0035_02550 [Niabella yanshanensis]